MPNINVIYLTAQALNETLNELSESKIPFNNNDINLLRETREYLFGCINALNNILSRYNGHNKKTE